MKSSSHHSTVSVVNVLIYDRCSQEYTLNKLSAENILSVFSMKYYRNIFELIIEVF